MPSRDALSPSEQDSAAEPPPLAVPLRRGRLPALFMLLVVGGAVALAVSERSVMTSWFAVLACLATGWAALDRVENRRVAHGKANILVADAVGIRCSPDFADEPSDRGP
jgi:hypothetical protein